MSLFFITGVPGAGKTEVWHQLKARGYEAFDTDEDGFSQWHNNSTGYIHPKSSIKSEDRTEAFLSVHSWKISRQKVEELSEHAKDRTVFLTGVAANEDEISDLFRAMFALYIDDETLKHRHSTRINNDWGKQPHELQQTLEHQHEALEAYRKFGHIVINANRPVDVVVDDILEKTEALESK